MTKFNIDGMRTDAVLEVEGVWEDIGNGFRLLIARVNNTHYLADLRKQMVESTVDLEDDEDALQAHIRSSLATAVVLNWEGMYRDMTEEEIASARNADEDVPADRLIEVPYSYENAVTYLTDVPDFYRLVLKLSGSTARFRSKNVADQAKT